MKSHTLLIIEDNPEDAIRILEFIGGINFGELISQKYPGFIEGFPESLNTVEMELPSMPLTPLGKTLINIFGDRAKLRAIVVGNKKASQNFLTNPENVNDAVLTFMDLQIPGAEVLEIGEGAEKKEVKIAISVFEQLLELHIPVFVLSEFLKPAIFEKLQQTARGRFFAFYHKSTFFDVINGSEMAARSESNFIASLVYTKPFYNMLLQLRASFKQDFPGSRAIASELSSLYKKKSEDHARQEDYYRAEIEEIKLSMRSGFHLPEMGANDEVARLKAVLLHEPGLETELVTPKNCDDLLFNQPVNTRKFIEQYRKFRAVIEAIAKETGCRVYTVKELLKQLLENETYGQFLRSKLILGMLEGGSNSPDKFWELLKLSVTDLIDVSLAGTTRERTADIEPFFPPIANFMFTRDWGFTVHNRVFLSNMNKPARIREKNIARFIFEFHPLFQQIFQEQFSALSVGTIEGGDIMLASPRTIVVGLSERTDFEAIQKFAELVFGQIAAVETIIATQAPREHPKSMHLDTFMGFLDRETVLMYEDILVKKKNPQFIFRRGKEIELKVESFEKVLREVLVNDGILLKVISVSDKNEQYDDACNIFAVAPGKALIYERVPNTIEKIRQAGWQVEEFDVEFDDQETPTLTKEATERLKKLLADPSSKVLIKVPGDELSLARGGPHCMTFPLSREKN